MKTLDTIEMFVQTDWRKEPVQAKHILLFLIQSTKDRWTCGKSYDQWMAQDCKTGEIAPIWLTNNP